MFYNLKDFKELAFKLTYISKQFSNRYLKTLEKVCFIKIQEMFLY
jgi:hypothetical protein